MPGAKCTLGLRNRLWPLSTIGLADPLSDLALGRPGQQPVNQLGLELRVIDARNPAQRICRQEKFGEPLVRARICASSVEYRKLTTERVLVGHTP